MRRIRSELTEFTFKQLKFTNTYLIVSVLQLHVAQLSSYKLATVPTQRYYTHIIVATRNKSDGYPAMGSSYELNIG